MKKEKKHIDHSGYRSGPKTVEEAVDWYMEYNVSYDRYVCGYKGEVIESQDCDFEMYEKCGCRYCNWCDEPLKKYCEGCRECLEEGKDDGKDED